MASTPIEMPCYPTGAAPATGELFAFGSQSLVETIALTRGATDPTVCTGTITAAATGHHKLVQKDASGNILWVAWCPDLADTTTKQYFGEYIPQLARFAPFIIGTTSGAGTVSEIFVHGGVTATSTNDGTDRTDVSFS